MMTDRKKPFKLSLSMKEAIKILGCHSKGLLISSNHNTPYIMLGKRGVNGTQGVVYRGFLVAKENMATKTC